MQNPNNNRFYSFKDWKTGSCVHKNRHFFDDDDDYYYLYRKGCDGLLRSFLKCKIPVWLTTFSPVLTTEHTLFPLKNQFVLVACDLPVSKYENKTFLLSKSLGWDVGKQ